MTLTNVLRTTSSLPDPTGNPCGRDPLTNGRRPRQLKALPKTCGPDWDYVGKSRDFVFICPFIILYIHKSFSFSSPNGTPLQCITTCYGYGGDGGSSSVPDFGNRNTTRMRGGSVPRPKPTHPEDRRSERKHDTRVVYDWSLRSPLGVQGLAPDYCRIST